MANKIVLDFALKFYSDGSDLTVAMSLLTGPFSLAVPGGAGYQLQGALSAVPSSIDNLAGDGGNWTPTATIAASIVTFTLPAAQAAGFHTITGTLEYTS